MLCQRGLDAEAFDAVLLYDCILPSIGGGKFADEFFIRKASAGRCASALTPRRTKCRPSATSTLRSSRR